jgi:hypothetical protein
MSSLPPATEFSEPRTKAPSMVESKLKTLIPSLSLSLSLRAREIEIESEEGKDGNIK